jgi:hypothetical protein
MIHVTSFESWTGLSSIIFNFIFNFIHHHWVCCKLVFFVFYLFFL